MTEIQLCKAIREKLAVILKDIYHPTDDSRGRDQEFKAPEIVNGYLPPKRSDNIPDFPCVIVRPSEGDTEMDDGSRPQDITKVKLLIGSYSRDDDGYEYALVIFRRITTALRKELLLDEKFRMRPKIKWQMPDEQARVVWYIEATTEWEVPTVQEVLEDDGYAS